MTGSSALIASEPRRDNRDDATPPVQQYLTFVVGTETFALGILRIKEIIEYGQPTAVPMMPASVRGVINLRGAVVPVVDLSSRFFARRSEITRKSCIVILEVDGQHGTQVIGLVVDAVNEVLEIPSTDIEPPPSFGARVRSEFIAGMARLGQRFVIVLDPARVLAVDELAQLAADIPHDETRQ